jgi:hypothetical protein
MTNTKNTAPSKRRGRPPKDKTKANAEVKEKVVKERSKLKHIFRGISPQGLYNESLGTAPVEEVEAYVELFLNDGYELKFVRHLERVKSPETNEVAGEQMLYVLVKHV